MAADDRGALIVGDGSAAAACDDEEGERSLAERAATLTNIREGVASDSAMGSYNGSMLICNKMMKCTLYLSTISFTSRTRD